MVTNNSANIATGAISTVLTGQGVASSPTFSATPTLTSVTFGSGTALSVYAEGTWTPTVVGGGTAGTTTYSLQNGYYTKIGNMVTVWGQMNGSAATGTGAATIGGLPFTIKSQAGYAPQGSISLQNSATWVYPTATTYATIQGTSNTTTAVIAMVGSAAATATLQMANAAFSLLFCLSYQV